MAETLLAILLATSSAKGSHLITYWPPNPHPNQRLARPRPDDFMQYDNPWRAAHPHEAAAPTAAPRWQADESYLWRRPHPRSRSPSRATPHVVHPPPSGRSSPTKDSHTPFEVDADQEGSDEVLGYSAAYLAGVLCPKRSMCHQKFALKVDDLMFLGHPVCAEPGGQWRFKDRSASRGPSTGASAGDPRGRRARARQVSGDSIRSNMEGEDKVDSSPSPPQGQSGGWLQTFHVVFVHDLPDPSSAASGNVQKYFDAIYTQLAFPLTAVLFAAQVTSNFVEAECDELDRGETSELAGALRELYEAIKRRDVARVSVAGAPLELQLPPALDGLIRSGEEEEVSDELPVEEGASTGLPGLAPWKSLLLLGDAYEGMRSTHVGEGDEDKLLAEQLMRFLEMADVTLSLADMASLLDWDLDSQVYPIVRWLVHHRRARVVDIVHRGLKNVFTLPLKFDKPLRELSASYRAAFPDQSLPSLPSLLSTISQSTSTTFFAAIVQTRDALPVYRDVVQWLLRNELLIALRLRVRVVATAALKKKVRKERKRKGGRRVSWQQPEATEGEGSDAGAKAFARRGRRRNVGRVDTDVEEEADGEGEEEEGDEKGDKERGTKWLAQSPEEMRARPPILEEGLDFDEELDEKMRRFESDVEGLDEGERSRVAGDEDEDEEDEEEDARYSIIPDPARADVRQRAWLQAMSVGKEPGLARRFGEINRYFDGRCADDEILFRAEISRKQLREVLHHYEEYLQTFLHPS
ncbi:hypothetical protein PENSPDRAFT_655684 [Peniophora sp. CONT]|nr:hypothetical protein PENSPDRAFT_655684 [Peniophora sp. CONT]